MQSDNNGGTYEVFSFYLPGFFFLDLCVVDTSNKIFCLVMNEISAMLILKGFQQQNIVNE